MGSAIVKLLETAPAGKALEPVDSIMVSLTIFLGFKWVTTWVWTLIEAEYPEACDPLLFLY